MKQLSIKRFLRSTLLLVAVCSFANVQAQDDLQEFINSTTTRKKVAKASGEIIITDLSQFSATNRSTTLNVANGKKYRFINGTLTRQNSLDGPIIHVGGDSYVEFADGASIDAYDSPSRKEAVMMDGGEVVVANGGKIRGHKYTSADLGVSPLQTPFAAVRITTNSDRFTTQDGATLYNTVICEPQNAYVAYEGGTWDGDAHFYNYFTASDVKITSNYWQTNFNIMLTEKNCAVDIDNHTGDVPPNMTIEAPKKVSDDIVVKGCHSYFMTEEWYIKQHIYWQGNSKYQLRLKTEDRTIRLFYDDLQDWIDDPDRPSGPDYYPPCGCVIPWIIYVPCNTGMNMKKDAEFHEDDLDWFINGKEEDTTTDDCYGFVEQGDHDVKIPTGSRVWYKWLRWRGCGCQGKHIWVWGTLYIDYTVWFTYYWRFIHVMPGGKVIVKGLDGDCDETVFHMEGGEVDYHDGDCKGTKYGWYCLGGEIYIRGGKLTGGSAGGWTGPNGCSYHYGGTVHGGIHNYGIHYLYGGTCTGGGSYTIYNYKGGKFYYYGGTCSDGGKIWNEGDLYIDGGSSDINCGDIFCVRGCHIYILRKLIFNIRLIFTKENIILNEPIVLGGNGYRLTAEDCEKIQITLPQGYGWRYDSTSGGIIIYSTSGVSNVEAGQPIVENTFDVTGRKVADSQRGVNIQRMSDGSVRKITVK